MVLGKRKALSMLPPPKKKRKVPPAIEEIKFDQDAREDFLTGFHKRKLQRIKHAQEEAAKREREDKIKARKILREGRKAELEKHVEEMNALLNVGNREGSETEDADSEDKEWEGIEETPLHNHEAEYLDDDRFTTVTVQAVDVSRNGFQNSGETQENEGSAAEYLGDSKDDQRTSSKVNQRNKTLSSEQQRKPKRKKRFRYENKTERKVTRHKERSRNRKQARERKS
ncbi:MAG: hypothetical protein Q9191_005985 [Dirinaria sp. TL-2023a]